MPMPARRQNKSGKIERKHRALNMLARKLSMSDPRAPLRWAAKKSSFLTNVFYGSKIASAFELARGYTPRLHGAEGLHILPRSIIDACLDIMATRKLKKF